MGNLRKHHEKTKKQAQNHRYIFQSHINFEAHQIRHLTFIFYEIGLYSRHNHKTTSKAVVSTMHKRMIDQGYRWALQRLAVMVIQHAMVYQWITEQFPTGQQPLWGDQLVHSWRDRDHTSLRKKVLTLTTLQGLAQWKTMQSQIITEIQQRNQTEQNTDRTTDTTSLMLQMVLIMRLTGLALLIKRMLETRKQQQWVLKSLFT